MGNARLELAPSVCKTDTLPFKLIAQIKYCGKNTPFKVPQFF